MREVYTLVLSVCAVLLGVEILARLFPEKSGTLVHALAVLAVVVTMVGGLLHLDLNFSAVRSDFTPEQSAEDSEALYAETGTTLLRERLRALLEAAGVAVVEDESGVEVWYTQQDDGTIEIDRVRVRVTYATDVDRAYALLNSVLTEAIPTEVYAG